MDTSEIKLLVTGGAGFIGSHTVVELQSRGYHVTIVDNMSNSKISVVDSIEKITGVRPSLEVFDITDFQRTLEFFSQHNNLDGVIHFAALKAVGESVHNPLKYYRNNLLSLLNVLEGMKFNEITKIVFSSSCTVYGQPKILPVDEDAPILVADSPYGNTKQISEEIISDMAEAYQFNAINLRYFNPIGAHKSALIGELPLGKPDNLLPFITQTALGVYPYLKIFGGDYNTDDGTPIRDYIHVVDVARAHVDAIERIFKDKMIKSVENYNLGTGIGYSVLQIVKTFEKISGVKLNYKIVPRRDGDIEQIWSNPKLANKMLGWEAKYGLETMVRSAWEWEQAYRRRLNG